MNLTRIPAFQDNYIWMLNDTSGRCLIVDPGEAAPVIQTLAQNQWQPVAILLTHHHHDHVGGVEEIVANYPNITVYGPEETRNKGTTHIVNDGQIIDVLGLSFTIFATPGHTLGHISYFSFPYLFCGDTLFSGGCGRLFEGTAKQMFESFQKINSLPADTLICCAHEYTLSNLIFSHALYPQHQEIDHYLCEIKTLREKNCPTLPTTLEKERKINIFLMTQDIELQKLLGLETSAQHEWQIFAALRSRKDTF